MTMSLNSMGILMKSSFDFVGGCEIFPVNENDISLASATGLSIVPFLSLGPFLVCPSHGHAFLFP